MTAVDRGGGVPAGGEDEPLDFAEDGGNDWTVAALEDFPGIVKAAAFTHAE